MGVLTSVADVESKLVVSSTIATIDPTVIVSNHCIIWLTEINLKMANRRPTNPSSFDDADADILIQLVLRRPCKSCGGTDFRTLELDDGELSLRICSNPPCGEPNGVDDTMTENDLGDLIGDRNVCVKMATGCARCWQQQRR